MSTIAAPGNRTLQTGNSEKRHLECAPAIVVNCAAYTSVDRAEDEPGAAFAVNATGAELVARAAPEIGAPIVHISIAYVFDGESIRLYIETYAESPLSVYGRSKLGERVRSGGSQPSARNSADGLAVQPVRIKLCEDVAASQ